MGCSVTHYWEEHIANLEAKLRVVVDCQPASESMIRLIDGNPREGIIEARIFFFDENAFLDVIERVSIREGEPPRRLKYTYHFQVDGEFVERFDYDPKLPEPLQHHVNRPGGIHLPSNRTSLKKAIEACYDLLDVIRNDSGPDDD